MELTAAEQFVEQVKKSRKVLIALPEAQTIDSVASALAMKIFLAKLGKDAIMASSGNVSEQLKFLPGAGTIEKQLPYNKSFVIAINTTVKKLEELSYQTDPGKAKIFLKSDGPEFTAEDISFSVDKYPVDLVITLGIKSLDQLGHLYEQYTDLFFETPKINIDNQAGNEYFGAINLVDITATSSSEILSDLFEKFDQALDQDIATCLLAGLIASTQSFQQVQTTPRALLKASQLVAMGGRQQEIIKNIYKTKALSLLKLWGRALARMKILEQEKVIYSVLGLNDFEKAGSNASELLPTLREFLDNVSGYRLIALVAEPEKNSVRLLLGVHQELSPEKVADMLGSGAQVIDTPLGGYKVVEQNLPGISLDEAERRLLEAITAL